VYDQKLIITFGEISVSVKSNYLLLVLLSVTAKTKIPAFSRHLVYASSDTASTQSQFPNTASISIVMHGNDNCKDGVLQHIISLLINKRQDINN